MTEHDLLPRIGAAKRAFGVKCTKFAGAVTVEVLCQAFCAAGLPVSHRDVFVRGLPVENDLLVPPGDAVAADGLVYEP